jgi:superfamily II DNA or RNA helicase
MPKRHSAVTGSELFIVDNSEEDWKAQRYLRDWCQLSKAIDIATGYFEIGALLSLDGEWQKVDKIRLLMGDYVSARTQKAFRDASVANWNNIKGGLDASIESTKDTNAFLVGVPAIVDALRSGKIECKAYTKDKFHAKAYITHARMEVIGSSALVGSSNLTVPGLTENIELNVQITGTPVAVLQEWYEERWVEAEDVTPDILKLMERHVAEYTPFEVYAKALHELFADSEYSAEDWEVVGADKRGSKVFPQLDRYQQEGYRNLLRIAQQYRGAFLCDGVGLGKTFIGLMLLERLVIKDRKRVVLIVPKSGRTAVWESTIKRYCPELLSGFLPLRIINHTDLTRVATDDVDWPGVMEDIRLHADVVIIDEAHNFRNPGVAGQGEKKPSRYRQLSEMLSGPAGAKQLYLLTATPINNSMHDFRYLLELFTQRDEAYFAQTMGINNLRAHFIALERRVKKSLADAQGTPAEADQIEVDIELADKTLANDRLFHELVVQRSRAYVRASQIQDGKSEATFPEREAPAVAHYSVKKTYGALLEMVDRAFNKQRPLFVLPIYNPIAYLKGDAPTDDQSFAFQKNRQLQVVGLIRTQFLKRFESSAHAFGRSCERLMFKLLAWVQVHAESPTEIRRLERWKAAHPEITGFFEQIHLEFEPEGDDSDDDLIPQEMLDAVEQLDRDEYDVEAMIDDCIDDLNQIAEFTKELAHLDASRDDKLKALIALLKKDAVLKSNKCLIFTEFADTARYLKRSLVAAGIEGVESIDGDSKLDRGTVIRRFAPYYNNSSSEAILAEGQSEIRVLISTDVLSEGLNLQDATRLINYDIHWNPVRLMQRIGRVDRRMNPATEAKIIADHPEQRKLRGHVKFWNFLPPAELNQILTLYSRVTHKVLRISETFGIEGRKLLTPEDELNTVREFNEDYEGQPSALEMMRLEYRGLVGADETLEARLNALPGQVFSGKANPLVGSRAVFCCYRLPVKAATTSIDSEAEWITEKGSAEWYLIDLTTGQVREGAESLHELIRCSPTTPRRCEIEQLTLLEARRSIEKHIKNAYLKRVQAPVGIKPVLSGWMELN